MNALQSALAARIAPVVLANITTRYPYHDVHLFERSGEAADPAAAHPAFANSYDWHSSVHSHWTAIQLLEHFAQRAEAPAVAGKLHAAIACNLTAANVSIETVHLAAHSWYERPYGRAWALALAAATRAATRSDVRALSTTLHPLADRVRADTVAWLARMPAPVRHGVHGNTAFALGLMFDAARTLGFDDLERIIAARARQWFAGDRGYPHAWERSGHDFLSPGLAEADLMRRVLDADEFFVWRRGFLGRLTPEDAILSVAPVPEGADGQIVHLHGLNLSRAGMLARIAALGGDDADVLLECAQTLYRAGIEPAVGEDYLSTHWLATFAWDAAAGLDAA